MLAIYLTCWRAVIAWLRALVCPDRLLRDMRDLPYRGAPVSVDARGRLRIHPATDLSTAARNRRRLLRAMRSRHA